MQIQVRPRARRTGAAGLRRLAAAHEHAQNHHELRFVRRSRGCGTVCPVHGVLRHARHAVHRVIEISVVRVPVVDGGISCGRRLGLESRKSFKATAKPFHVGPHVCRSGLQGDAARPVLVHRGAGVDLFRVGIGNGREGPRDGAAHRRHPAGVPLTADEPTG